MGQEGRPGEVLATARVDLHCHTSASFDGVADPVALVARAVERGLTHVAITDHDTLEGARRAVEAAPVGLRVLVGCEVNTTDGDLVFVFLRAPIAKGLSAREAIQAGRAQGALVGIPHPYDHSRRSLLLDPANEALVPEVDWVEAWNGRVGRRAANEQAATLARRFGRPAIGVSDAHALIEVGTVWTTMSGDPGNPEGLLAALGGPMAIVGPAPAPAPRGRGRFRRPGTRRAGTTR
jgi:predicted metal-dependent phosphoesterase TrpH